MVWERESAALRRVAAYGDGWLGLNLTPDEAATKIQQIQALLTAAGRTRSDIELAVSPFNKLVTSDSMKRYRDAGVDEIPLVDFALAATEREMIAHWEKIAREWVEPALKL